MTMKSRTSEAKDKPKPIRLTDRDRRLFRSLADYGVLSTEQVFRLHFSSIHRTRKRLRLLWRHRFIKRNVRLVRMGEGSSQYLYTLTARGRRIPGHGASAVALPNQDRRFSTSEHTLRINDFRVAISLACRNGTGLVLKDWRQGHQIRFNPTVTTGNLRTVVPIIPDSFFTIQYGGRDFGYFLEIDRGTADLGRIRKKLLAYLNLWHSGLVSAKIGIRSFRLLYITSSEQRLANLLKTMQDLAKSTRRIGICCVTVFSRYSLANSKALLEPIWQTIDHSGYVVRTSPFPGSIPLKLPIAPGKPPVCEPEV